MATHDYNIANQGFPAFRADLNDALAAIVSNNSNATAPATTFAHMLWVDTAANPSVLKIRNADNDAWITIGSINQTDDKFKLTPADGVSTDTISELTSAAGVTIDGVLLKDSGVVTGAGTVSAPVYSTTGDLNTGIFFPAADTIAFAEGGAEAMRIDSSGNVGIGTSSLAAGTRVQVVGGHLLVGDSSTTAGLSTPGIKLRSENAVQIVRAGAEPLEINRQTNDGGVIDIYKDGALTGRIGTVSGGLYFGSGSSGTERMRIDSSGNLLVGTTTLGDTHAYFNIGSNSRAILNLGSSTTSSTILANFRNPNGAVGSITTSGSATAYNTSSDYRLKHDIQPMTGALAKVALLKPVTYKWNADDSSSEGFIAHEIQEVAPYAVTGEKDGEEMQGVDYGKITPLLTAALQEAIAEIQSLKARVAELEVK